MKDMDYIVPPDIPADIPLQAYRVARAIRLRELNSKRPWWKRRLKK